MQLIDVIGCEEEVIDTGFFDSPYLSFIFPGETSSVFEKTLNNDDGGGDDADDHDDDGDASVDASSNGSKKKIETVIAHDLDISDALLISVDLAENEKEILTFDEKFVHQTIHVLSEPVKVIDQASSNAEFSIIGEIDGKTIPLFSVQLEIAKIEQKDLSLSLVNNEDDDIFPSATVMGDVNILDIQFTKHNEVLTDVVQNSDNYAINSEKNEVMTQLSTSFSDVREYKTTACVDAYKYPHTDYIYSDFTTVSHGFSDNKEEPGPQIPKPEENPKPNDTPRDNDPDEDENNRNRDHVPPVLPVNPGGPNDRGNRPRQPPRLPIGDGNNPARPPTTTTPRPIIVWNATITRFPDPEDKRLVWGVVFTSTLSVFSMSVTMIVLCWWNKGPRLYMRTKNAILRSSQNPPNVENLGPREAQTENIPLKTKQPSEETIYDEAQEREKRKRTGLTPPPANKPPATIQVEVHQGQELKSSPSVGAEGGYDPAQAYQMKYRYANPLDKATMFNPDQTMKDLKRPPLRSDKTEEQGAFADVALGMPEHDELGLSDVTGAESTVAPFALGGAIGGHPAAGPLAFPPPIKQNPLSRLKKQKAEEKKAQ